VAKFYTSATTTTTKKTQCKGYKGFFWGGKKKAPKSPYFERKKSLKLSYLDDIFIPPMGLSKQTRILFSF
jgi:hypothetical protein